MDLSLSRHDLSRFRSSYETAAMVESADREARFDEFLQARLHMPTLMFPATARLAISCNCIHADFKCFQQMVQVQQMRRTHWAGHA
jgi:hypothetical protein